MIKVKLYFAILIDICTQRSYKNIVKIINFITSFKMSLMHTQISIFKYFPDNKKQIVKY